MNREELYQKHFSDWPRYRAGQIFGALFEPRFKKWEDVTTLNKNDRNLIATRLPWMSLEKRHVLESARHDTFKALLATHDGKMIETVLMQNARGFWSICVSSQVGCAMACTFCATGKMGFTRNLTSDEIIDQYRFWMYFLDGRHDLEQRISNVVYMGMGEPLANYENVKQSLKTLLEYTEMGPTRLTVSTVGLLPMLSHILKDPEWPPVRLAVSLHSADTETRKNIMPSSYDAFLENLEKWTKEYFERFDSKRRHLTLEYIMLAGVNDTPMHAKKLIQFARRVGKVKINLIPYNDTKSRYHTSAGGAFLNFEKTLQMAGVDATRRRTMGADIAAACGQLIVEEEKTSNTKP